MRIIGCGLHARQQTVAMLDHHGRGGENDSEARRPQGAGILFHASRTIVVSNYGPLPTLPSGQT